MSPAIDERTHAEFLRALSRADEEAAIGVAVRLTEAGLSVPDVLSRLIAPAQWQIGERWADNRWSVAQEHAATYINDRVIAALALRVPAPRPVKGQVVLACVDGEWHALPARMVGETLRHEGWQVTFLGACTPAAHLAQFIRAAGPDTVALSCSIATALPKARSMIEAIRSAGVPVLAGGPGFGPQGRWALQLGADAWAPDAAGAAARLADGWPAVIEPAPDLRYLVDDEHAELAESRTVLLDRTVARFAGAGSGPAAHSDQRPESFREDIGRILDVLVAGLLVDDAALVETYTRWLLHMRAARGLPAEVMAAAFDVLADELAGFPRAVRLLKAGRALIAE